VVTGVAPSIDSETTSPTMPVPEIVGSEVVVSVDPLAGLVMTGAAGGGGAILTVKASVAAVELGPPEAAWVADRVWLPLPSGLVKA
jgi:hypothetical protein